MTVLPAGTVYLIISPLANGLLVTEMKSECIVFEDTPKGVECAQNANMKTVVLLSGHKKEEFSHFNNIIDFIKYISYIITKINFR